MTLSLAYSLMHVLMADVANMCRPPPPWLFTPRLRPPPIDDSCIPCCSSHKHNIVAADQRCRNRTPAELCGSGARRCATPFKCHLCARRPTIHGSLVFGAHIDGCDGCRWRLQRESTATSHVRHYITCTWEESPCAGDIIICDSVHADGGQSDENTATRTNWGKLPMLSTIVNNGRTMAAQSSAHQVPPNAGHF